MRPGLFVLLALLTLVAAAGGLVVLAVWDIPVTQTTVEKPVDPGALSP